MQHYESLNTSTVESFPTEDSTEENSDEEYVEGNSDDEECVIPEKLNNKSGDEKKVVFDFESGMIIHDAYFKMFEDEVEDEEVEDEEVERSSRAYFPNDTDNFFIEWLENVKSMDSR